MFYAATRRLRDLWVSNGGSIFRRANAVLCSCSTHELRALMRIRTWYAKLTTRLPSIQHQFIRLEDRLRSLDCHVSLRITWAQVVKVQTRRASTYASDPTLIDGPQQEHQCVWRSLLSLVHHRTTIDVYTLALQDPHEVTNRGENAQLTCDVMRFRLCQVRDNACDNFRLRRFEVGGYASESTLQRQVSGYIMRNLLSLLYQMRGHSMPSVDLIVLMAY